MSKFCGKCGSKINEETGICPVCDRETITLVEKQEQKSPSKRKGLFLALFILLGIVLLTSVFFTLDYFDIIGIGVSKNLGLKASGSFDLYSSSSYLFTSKDEQLITFYCKPPKGCNTKLSGDYSAEFVDDGQPGNEGDVKKNDGVYSVNVLLSEASPKIIEVYAVAKDGLKFYESNHLKIEIKDSLSDSEQAAIDEVDSSIYKLLTSEKYKKFEYKNKVESVKQLLEELSSDGKKLISKDSVFFDEESSVYTFAYSNGDLGCVKIEKNDKEDGFIYGEPASDTGNSNNSSNTNENCNALIMYDWYTDKEPVLEIYREYERQWNEKGLSTTLTENPTVSQYATQLANNELILIASHGSRWSLKNSWFENPVKYSVVCTHEKCTKELNNQYKNDISQKNIVKANTESGQFYWILPSFFSVHYNKEELDNTIMLMDNCNGMGSDGDIDYDLASSLTGDNGAAIGFHNSVNIFKFLDRKDDTYYALGYGTSYLKSIADYLIAGLSFSEAAEKTKKIYGSNQKIYMNNFWSTGSDEDAQVFPMISGNGSAKLSLSNSSDKEFKVAKQFLSVNSKYIVSDKNAIYLKDCVAEQGKKIAAQKNTGQIMSDGETVYFTVSNGFDKALGHEQYDVYSANIYDNSVNKVFSGNYEADLVACKNNAIYYIDEEIPQQGYVTYLATLMKYDIASGTKEVVSKNFPAASACYFKGKIYCSNALLGTNLINEFSVYSYDVETGKSEEVAKSSTMSKPSYITTSDMMYFQSFSYKDNAMTNQHLYCVNQNGELKKSAEYPDNYIMLSVCEDNQTAILRKINKDSTANYYTFDLESGKVSSIISDTPYVLWAINDEKKDNTFLVKFPYNSSGDKTTVSVSKLENGKLIDYYVDGKQYTSVHNLDFWIEDGFLIDENMDCHILSKQ